MRRTAEQEHATLLTVDPDGTERTLIDPMALDASGLTTLDSWQPSKEGDLLAYQLSEGGTEESVIRVMDVVTGEIVDGPIDRARYSPIAWVPGGKALLLRAPARRRPRARRRGAVPPPRVAAPRSAPTRTTDTMVFGDGPDPTNYYGVSVVARRSLDDVSPRRGHRAAQRPVARRPAAPARSRTPRPARRAGGRRREHRRRGRPRRPRSTSSPTSTHRAAGCASRRPSSRRRRALARPDPRGPRARCSTASRSSTARR